MDASDVDDRVEKILQQILASVRESTSATFSTGTYADQPIIRKGSDFRRDAEAERERRQAQAQRREDAARRAQARRSSEQAAQAREARDRAWRTAWSYDEASPFDDPVTARQTSGARTAATAPKATTPKDTPELLRQLVALGKGQGGKAARSGEVFVQQARLAEDYEDDVPWQPVVARTWTPTYQSLSLPQLRSYFAWRTALRHGEDVALPSAFVLIHAFELLADVGCEHGEDALEHLERLADLCETTSGSDSVLSSSIRVWRRDYAVLNGLDPALVVPADELARDTALATLRRAERTTLAQEGLHDLTQADMPLEVPTDAQVWEAMGAAGTYRPERSPFFREHPEEAAAVGAEVFRRMVVHCGKRRKTDLVDGLFGPRTIEPYSPLAGTPFAWGRDSQDVTYQLSPCVRVECRSGRWRLHRAYTRRGRNAELGRMLHAIDRQMRDDWAYPKPLKERSVPRYLQTMVAKASAAEHERTLERERRTIHIDVSQLAQIRSAAATTREALLVDEEREEMPMDEPPARAAAQPVVAQPCPAPGTPQPNSAAAPAQGRTGMVPPQAATDKDVTLTAGTSAPTAPADATPADANPCGLTDLELAVARRILEDRDFQDLLGPGAPMESVIVDAINEKLFDAVGDAVIEYGDAGPQLIEDYKDDVRELIAL